MVAYNHHTDIYSLSNHKYLCILLLLLLLLSLLQYVVNYDFPSNLEQYCHRIGRTGRQGAKGHAYSLISRNMAPMCTYAGRGWLVIVWCLDVDGYCSVLLFYCCHFHIEWCIRKLWSFFTILSNKHYHCTHTTIILIITPKSFNHLLNQLIHQHQQVPI